MAKKAVFQELSLRPPEPGWTKFRWLYQALRSAILEGRLQPGSRLPSTRNFASQYGVARGTIVAVFEQLQAEGYIESRVGMGSVVATRLPDDFLQARSVEEAQSAVRPSGVGLSIRGQRLADTPFPVEPVCCIGRAFRANQPALDAFPLTLWSQVAARRLRRAPRTLLAHGDARGYSPLREAVAGYLGSARGVKCNADQVFIVSGIQQALDLVARLLLDPGDHVWVEDPGYQGIASVLAGTGADVVPVPVDAEGLDIATAEQLNPHSRAAYVTPAHQFPLGMTLSLERRLALLRWAERTHAWIFEDDYDSEYRYVGRPLAALQGLDQSGSVIYSGSFTKMLFPALRLGYIVIPLHLVDAFMAARSVVDRYPAGLDQAILCDFITEGHFGHHIRRMRELYAARLSALTEAVEAKLGGLLDLADTASGLQTVGWLSSGIGDRDAAASASAYDLEVLPLSAFAIKHPVASGLLLGFATVDEEAITQGVDRLADALHGHAP